MKKRILLFLFFLIAFRVSGFSSELKPPILIAKEIFEKSSTLRFKEIERYYCDDAEFLYDIGLIYSESLVSHYKENGIDYYIQEFHDFSGIDYKVEYENDKYIIIKIEGKGSQGFSGTDFKKQIEISEKYKLMKINKNQYCLPADGKVKD